MSDPRFYLVTLDGAETDTFPVWTIRLVGTEQVPVRYLGPGATETRWTARETRRGVVHGKRAVLAVARRLAERDQVPLLVEELSSVQRRKIKRNGGASCPAT